MDVVEVNDNTDSAGFPELDEENRNADNAVFADLVDLIRSNHIINARICIENGNADNADFADLLDINPYKP